MGAHTITVWQIVRHSPAVTVPILLCSVVAIGLIAERSLFFWGIRTDIQQLMQRIREQVKRHQIREALALCDNVRHPVAGVLKAGILNYDRPRSQIKEAIEDASLYEIPRLEKNLPALATIAHIAPLLGLLGTAVGMARSFASIAIRSSNLEVVTVQDLAGGVWEALLATVAGLVVAIPAFVAYNYFVSLVNSSVLEMEKASTELVNFMTE
ncbi:MAG: MotA/TolQ/ExbB proton channel family protein [Candidatus Omnitrophica bacterium]|nr:MotA/TolQ/ExbB proton channel family protein [Candidatus Omnitrophota bacterium]